MPKKFIQRYLPHPDHVKEHKYLKLFGDRLHDPHLWHLHRRSVGDAFSVGLFCAFIPVPFQMVLAALGAIFFRTNLPLAVALVWITNPLTMGPIFYTCYLIGAFILGVEETSQTFEFTLEWLTNGLTEVWNPLLLGCFIISIVTAIIGNVLMRALWRYVTIKRWQHRKHSRLSNT